ARGIAKVHVKTDKDAASTAKKSAGLVNHIVETRNLYFTAAADHIFPFALGGQPWIVVLPTLADPGDPGFGPITSDKLRAQGGVNAAAWLDGAEGQWRKLRKKGEKKSLSERLDYMGHLGAQANRSRWVVVYTAVGKRPVGCVIDTK